MKGVASRALLMLSSILLTISIIASSGGFSMEQADGAISTTLSSSPVIRVNNDTDLASLIAANHWNGTGMAADPYIIDNLIINATDKGDAIYIGNTSKYLKINNCQLVNLYNYSRLQFSNIGIKLFNVTNVVVEYNILIGDGLYGISLKHSRFNTVSNNNCSGSRGGIILAYSNNNTVSNNNCKNTFLALQDSNNNTVSNNTADGIGLGDSNYNIVTNNTCNGNHGLSLIGSNNNIVTNNTCIVDASILSDTGLALQNSRYNTISNNTFKGDNFGIGLYASSDNTLSNNTCSGDGAGIYMNLECRNNYLFGNIGTVLDKTGTGSSGSNNFDDLFPVVLISFVLLVIVIIFVLTGKKHQQP
jgi:parallel beta-helix repeat protein